MKDNVFVPEDPKATDEQARQGRIDARDAYAHFDAREMGWTKVVLKPNGIKASGTKPSTRPEKPPRGKRKSAED